MFEGELKIRSKGEGREGESGEERVKFCLFGACARAAGWEGREGVS